MIFLLVSLVTAIACSIVTIKTLIGYSDLKRGSKVLISFIVVLGWFAPLIVGGISRFISIGDTTYSIISFIGYTLFGFMFLLLFTLVARDIVWYLIFGLAKLLHIGSWSINPKNVSLLARVNLATVFFTVVLSAYAMFEAVRTPAVNEINLSSPRLQKDMRIVQVSDIHITRATPLSRVYSIVNRVNELNPDVIFLTGDVIDDNVAKIDRQLNALGMLSAPYGIYSVMGNHEFYNGLTAWSYKFRQLGFNILFNRGLLIGKTNVFVSGIPDAGTAVEHPTFRINFERALKGSNRQNYRILLSHNPSLVDNLTSFNYNMMLSGHTHGGQIFPFHWLAQKANNYLAGLYKVNGIDLYVSRGAGTWGPSMRLFAPSEITLINLHAE